MPDAHPRYQDLPALSDPEYNELKASISEYGILEPVVVDENGTTLDGHHRARVCEELGIECPTRTLTGLSEEDKRDYVFMVNVARRHLSANSQIDLWKKRRTAIAARLKADPMTSDRQIARDLGLPDHKVVAKERNALNASGDIPQTVRPHMRADPLDADPPSLNNADHRGHAVVTVTIDYTVDNTAIRTRGDKYAPKERVDAEWQMEIPMATPVPDSMLAVRPFWVELAQRGEREMFARPLHTMRSLAAV